MHHEVATGRGNPDILHLSSLCPGDLHVFRIERRRRPVARAGLIDRPLPYLCPTPFATTKDHPMIKTLELNETTGAYTFEADGVSITDPLSSSCSRFTYDPEYGPHQAHTPAAYGFSVTRAGGNLTAWAQKMLLNGREVEMMISTDNASHEVPPTDPVYTVGVYHEGSPLIEWAIDRRTDDLVADVVVHEPDFLALPPPTDEEVLEQATQDALNAACAVIQRHLGVTDGDYAALYWEGTRSDELRDLLRHYMRAERAQG